MRRARRNSLLAVLGVAGAAAASLPIIALGGPGAQAPDLRADPVAGIRGPAVYSDTEGGLGAGRLLVRFDGFVTNVGQGPLEVSGNPQIPGNVRQLARTAPGQTPSVPVATPEVTYEAADSHDHFHLKRAMRYSLWNQARTAQVAPGQKVGFCLYDIEPAPAPSPAPEPQVYDVNVTQFCDQGNPGTPSLKMGTSVGWRDVYGQYLAFQWVDVSSTTPGIYYVGAEADPDNAIWEGGGAAEVNAPAFAAQAVTIPGWTAQPVNPTQTGAPQAVPLAAQKFGTQTDANLRYRVTSAPARGTLNVAVGQDFVSAQQLVYTPTPGYTGSDSFTYVARSTSSSFPLSPQAATVAIADNTPGLAISGAPASVVAGTSIQLSAALRNLAGGVTWTTTAGSVSPTGLYKAPAKPPAGGATTIRAASTVNAAIASQVAIRITPNKAGAKPDPFGTLTAGRRMLSALKIRRISKKVFVAKVVTGRRGGRVTMTTTFGRRVVARCSARVGARKGFTCKVTLKRSYPLKKVRVTAKLTVKGGKTAVRRSFVIR